MGDLTHADLVRAAARWLRGTRRCRVVLTERAGVTMEEPDAIGWRFGGTESILVECKTSRADFLADRKKPHRAWWGAGMGQERWFLTPPGLLRGDELPERWGLLETTGPRVRVVRSAAKAEAADFEVLFREAPLLVAELGRMQDDGLALVLAAVRRLQAGDLRKVHEEASKRLLCSVDEEPVVTSDEVVDG